MSAIALVANQALAQQQAERPPVEVTTSDPSKKKSSTAKTAMKQSSGTAATALDTYNPALDLDGVNVPPAKASKANLEMMTAMFAEFLVKARETARRINARNG